MLTRYFLCYHRDELHGFLIDGIPLSDRIAQKRREDSSFLEQTYFDDLDFVRTVPEIFERIEKVLNDPSTIMLIISDHAAFYGWAEREIVVAIKNGRFIYYVRPKTFARLFSTKWHPKTWSLEKIIKKSVLVYPKN